MHALVRSLLAEVLKFGLSSGVCFLKCLSLSSGSWPNNLQAWWGGSMYALEKPNQMSQTMKASIEKAGPNPLYSEWKVLIWTEWVACHTCTSYTTFQSLRARPAQSRGTSFALARNGPLPWYYISVRAWLSVLSRGTMGLQTLILRFGPCVRGPCGDEVLHSSLRAGLQTLVLRFGPCGRGLRAHRWPHFEHYWLEAHTGVRNNLNIHPTPI